MAAAVSATAMNSPCAHTASYIGATKVVATRPPTPSAP
eukprot:COSAG01_NODE_41072_length_456_cov_0.722689_1_plen_37_part_10